MQITHSSEAPRLCVKFQRKCVNPKALLNHPTTLLSQAASAPMGTKKPVFPLEDYFFFFLSPFPSLLHWGWLQRGDENYSRLVFSACIPEGAEVMSVPSLPLRQNVSPCIFSTLNCDLGGQYVSTQLLVFPPTPCNSGLKRKEALDLCCQYCSHYPVWLLHPWNVSCLKRVVLYMLNAHGILFYFIYLYTFLHMVF